MTNVVDLDAVREARKIAEIIEKTFGSELDRAKKHGCKLMVKLEEEEQLGRGTINVARVRLVPETNNARVRFGRVGNEAIGETAQAIEGRADFIDVSETDEAIKTAIDEAFTFATDHGVF